MENEFYLKNPPIKEVALALYIKSPKYDIDFINNFKDENMQDFPNLLPFKSVNIQINDNEEIKVSEQEDNAAYTLSNKENNEIWNMDIKRILFADKTKYKSFTNFLNKFLNKFDILYSKLENSLSVDYIALRYSNQFSFKIEELNKNIAILPLFNSNYNKKQYSTNTSYMCINNILNSENDKMNARVNTAFAVNEVNAIELLINFDIEVGYIIQNNQITKEQLDNYLIEMREFKNKIFFSNILKAKEVFN